MSRTLGLLSNTAIMLKRTIKKVLNSKADKHINKRQPGMRTRSIFIRVQPILARPSSRIKFFRVQVQADKILRLLCDLIVLVCRN